MKKFSEITEGLWNDMVKRGTTGEVRKEDNVDNLDMNGLFEYIKNHYTYKEGSKLKFFHGGKFSVRGNMQVPIKTLMSLRTSNKYIPTVMISYNSESEKIENLTLTSGANDFKDAVEIIKKKYPVRFANGSSTLYIDPSDDFEITNGVFIDVINIIIDNMEDPELLRK